MRTVIEKVKELGERSVKVKWIAPIAIILVANIGGLVWAVNRYDADLKDNRCQVAIESREELRGVFVDLFRLIDDISPGGQFTRRGAVVLDESYPPLTERDCAELLGP